MNLKFTKNADGELDLLFDDNGSDQEFNYVEMVKYLYKDPDTFTIQFEGDISDDEKKAIDSMFTEIKGTINRKEDAEVLE